MGAFLKKAVCAALMAASAPLFFAQNANAGAVNCGAGGGAVDLVTVGCVAKKNDPFGTYGPPGGDAEWAVEQAILLATNVAVDISLFGKVDNGTDFGLIELTPIRTDGKGGILTGQWKVLADDVFIKYITIKAATSYVLYELPGEGARSGSFSTEALVNRGGQRPAMSHISFWLGRRDVQVSEPAGVGFLGLGLVGVGLVTRSKRRR